MKAITIHEFGAPEGLAVIDLPIPDPTPGHARIAVEAIGVGGVDTLIRSGAVAAYGFEQGHIPGGEVAGTVTAVADDVDTSWIGRRVWAFTGVGGGYAEHALAPAATLVPLPPATTPADAVTLGSSGAVAHFALRHAHFTPGESLLVRGAAGGIGTTTIQLAARAGATTITATTSSPTRGARLQALGANHILPRTTEDPTTHDVIIDIVAGPDLPSFFAKLNPNGRIVTVGAIAGDPPPDFGSHLFAAFQKSLSFSTFSLNTIPLPARRAVIADLFTAAARGELQVVTHEVLPLAQAVSAHRMMDAGEVFGRIVLTP